MRMNIQKRPKPPKINIDTKNDGLKMYLLSNVRLSWVSMWHVLVFGGCIQSNHANMDTKELSGQKSNSLIFLNIALWSALRKVSQFQWSHQDVQTQRGFQSHPLDQTTASLTLNFGWFQRSKKHYHCNAPFNIGRNLAKKKHLTVNRSFPVQFV